MKKYGKFWLALSMIALTAIIGVLLVSCTSEDSNQAVDNENFITNIRVDNNVLKWNAYPGAYGYDVVIGDKSVKVDSASYEPPTFWLHPGSNDVSIQALNKNGNPISKISTYTAIQAQQPIVSLVDGEFKILKIQSGCELALYADGVKKSMDFLNNAPAGVYDISFSAKASGLFESTKTQPVQITKLAEPTFSVIDGEMYIDYPAGAGLELYLDGDRIRSNIVNFNSYSPGVYHIAMKAVGNGINTINSQKVIADIRVLDKVGNPYFDTGRIVWDKMDYVDGYEVKINQQKITLPPNQNYINIDPKWLNAGINEYQIRPISNQPNIIAKKDNTTYQILRANVPRVEIAEDKFKIGQIDNECDINIYVNQKLVRAAGSPSNSDDVLERLPAGQYDIAFTASGKNYLESMQSEVVKVTKLAAPNLYIKDGVLTLDKVDMANGYFYLVNDKSISKDTLTPQDLKDGNNKISVRSLGDNNTIISSAYSEDIYVTKPTINSVKYTSESPKTGHISWKTMYDSQHIKVTYYMGAEMIGQKEDNLNAEERIYHNIVIDRGDGKIADRLVCELTIRGNDESNIITTTITKEINI